MPFLFPYHFDKIRTNKHKRINNNRVLITYEPFGLGRFATDRYYAPQVFTKIGKIYKNDQIWCHKITYRYQNIEVKYFFVFYSKADIHICKFSLFR